jgi:hypothetical protein
MDNTSRTSASTAEGSIDPWRLDRPLPPFPPNVQQDGLTVDPREIMYPGFGGTPSRASHDHSFQYERLREAGYIGNPSEYYQARPVSIPPSGSSATPSSESRSRGRSAPQIHSTDDAANTQETARLDTASTSGDHPERYRASSSASSRPSVHSTLSNNSSDTPTSSRDPPTSQSRYRRSPSGHPEAVVPRWQPDVEATYCPICNAQFSKF